MDEFKNSIIDTILAIEDNAKLFYQQKSQEGLAELETTLNLLMQTVNQIISMQSGSEVKLVDEQQLNTALTEAMKAMEQKDNVLLADIMIFEINGLLKECLNWI